MAEPPAKRSRVAEDVGTSPGERADDKVAPKAKAAQAKKPAGGSGRGLRRDGHLKDVPGFEAVGLKVASNTGKKLPKTQSWCFVPLIFSALGSVPQHLRQEDTSTTQQIADAQAVWMELFSHWERWCKQLQAAINKFGRERFEEAFLPKGGGGGGAKRWTTSLVFGEPRVYGRLPHPQGKSQDRILDLLPLDTQNEIFASVMAIAQS
eukprot:TRINITY_DN104252_c0_g1_i1.p1 TRINITY_DN104252_c0_g1~~TRINITY_DN104252_c0_g1_i1.p1  ORF type:complete len:207 (-),score=50.81 TRINITY_DN104252_c0_g1_i1:302-922(-)